jgi:hypothetical protein
VGEIDRQVAIVQHGGAGTDLSRPTSTQRNQAEVPTSSGHSMGLTDIVTAGVDPAAWVASNLDCYRTPIQDGG